jgi:hypothetical protein
MLRKVIYIAAVFISSLALAHGGVYEDRVSVESENQAALVAGMIPYEFQLFDSQAQKVLGDQDLTESQTKILHMIVYDRSRNEFNHVHPVFNGKLWTAEFNLIRNGTYFIWAQGQLKDGTEFSSYTKAQIIGGLPEISPRPLGDSRKNSDHSTVIELDKTQVRAGQAAMINFTVTRDDGLDPALTPYLGAYAHLIAVSPDGDELIHVHPMAGVKPNTGMIHAAFPTEGDYRIWVQLLDHGELKTIPISISVLK